MDMKNDKTRNQKKLDRKLLEQEMEQEALLMQANEIKEETLSFGSDGEIEFKNELADMVVAQIENSQEKYHLYYDVLNKLLKKHLPKGTEYQKHRELIYEEKNTFLTRGYRKSPDGRRGADGRMAYNPDISELITAVVHWISNRGSMFDLYVQLRDLNKSKGYPLD